MQIRVGQHYRHVRVERRADLADGHTEDLRKVARIRQFARELIERRRPLFALPLPLAGT